MPTVTLQAHYDGTQIVLDEPFDLPRDVPLMVTLLPDVSEIGSDSEEAWLKAAGSSDAFEFLKDAAEDIYSLDDGEPFRDEI